jgi:membrane protein
MSAEIEPPPQTPRTPSRKDHRIGWLDPLAQRVWDQVSQSPLHNLWDFEGTPATSVWKRAFKAFIDDNLLSRAAELGYYFLFALFPTLVSASAILGLAAKSASNIYLNLLHYLTIMVPPSAYGIVIMTFNQTTAHATGGKVTFGLAAAVWSASVGFSAMQDGMNTVYKVRETRSFFRARGEAILVTLLLSLIVTLNLATLLGGDFLAHYAEAHIWHHWLAITVAATLRGLSWIVATTLLVLLFNTIYYFAPDLEAKHWHWLTPGAVIGILGWILASMGLRLYLHYFVGSFSVTYGSLGAVIVLLTWFYITGLMLLLGAEINSEIQAAVTEKRLKDAGTLPVEAEVKG